ncbi:MAG: hypothetical protein JKY33_10825 [Bacteroidia bacterium]|nr:hypothetical protein [Bacteroidia bacterium]
MKTEAYIERIARLQKALDETKSDFEREHKNTIGERREGDHSRNYRQIGDWVKFFRNGAMVISAIEYVPFNLSPDARYLTSVGYVVENEIIESRTKIKPVQVISQSPVIDKKVLNNWVTTVTTGDGNNKFLDIPLSDWKQEDLETIREIVRNCKAAGYDG